MHWAVGSITIIFLHLWYGEEYFVFDNDNILWNLFENMWVFEGFPSPNTSPAVLRRDNSAMIYATANDNWVQIAFIWLLFKAHQISPNDIVLILVSIYPMLCFFFPFLDLLCVCGMWLLNH